MSKERELLKRVRDTLRELKETHYDLYWDIQAELDLDEQVPVAWMCNLLGDVVTDKPADNNGYTALYKSPKREPSMTGREMYQRGYAAGRDLKRKPLSDANIAELWGEEHSGKTDMIKNFARAIEKAHGIGVENENS
jgi:hypothetical protein